MLGTAHYRRLQYFAADAAMAAMCLFIYLFVDPFSQGTCTSTVSGSSIHYSLCVPL
jgi:hypothetical protein